jgi:hypothetical protein
MNEAYIESVRLKAKCRQYIAVTDEVPRLCDEIERLWKRERQLLEANNVELEKRRTAEREIALQYDSHRLTSLRD